MKNKRVLILFTFSVIMITACNEEANKREYENISETEIIKEGKRLVTVLGCNDCHSPKVMTKYGPAPDENLLLSGHPMNLKISHNSMTQKAENWILFHLNGTATIGPWGVSYAANLTPDDSGIGTWTLEQFTRAMREGKFKGLKNGRQLLPPMPSVGYKELKNEEIEAMFKYLKSIKPIRNIVPTPIPPIQE